MKGLSFWLVFGFMLCSAPLASAADGQNLVQNSDCEEGDIGQMPKGWQAQAEGGAQGKVSLTDGDAHSGKKSVLIDHANDAGFIHPNISIKIARGEYLFRFHAKSDTDLSCSANIYWAGQKWQTLLSQGVKLEKDQWKAFEFPVMFVQDYPGSIQIGLRNAGRMWLDDVELVRVEKPGARDPATVVWDTINATNDTLTADELTRTNNWKLIPPGRKHTIKGDAVMANNKLTVVVRKNGHGAEVYARSGGDQHKRATLIPISAAGQRADALIDMDLIENESDGATLRTRYDSAKDAPIEIELRLGAGRAVVETTAGKGAGSLRVDAHSHYAILPDLFADDVVLDASTFPSDRTDLPSENLLMLMVGQGDTIVICVSESREKDMELTLSGSGTKRIITGSEIAFGKNRNKDDRIFVAALEGRDIWRKKDLDAGDAGKTMKLGWAIPYPAQWRVNFSQADGLMDSWDMIMEQPDGSFVKPGWLGGAPGTVPASRERWTTVLDTFKYPCWIDRDGHAHFQPLKSKKILFQGPAIIYAMNRIDRTPLDVHTLADVVRESLGAGPCEYALDIEGQKTQYKGIATCAARDALARIYEAKLQKIKRAEIEKVLSDVVVFIKFIRARIDSYVEFGHETRAYLNLKMKNATDTQKKVLAELDQIAVRIDERVADRKDKIQTPEHAIELVEDFRKNLIDYDGADAAEKVKKFSDALVVIGGNQDHLAGECRWVAKVLRQRAAIAMAKDPAYAPISREIRFRTQQILRNPASHEAPHH